MTPAPYKTTLYIRDLLTGKVTYRPMSASDVATALVTDDLSGNQTFMMSGPNGISIDEADTETGPTDTSYWEVRIDGTSIAGRIRIKGTLTSISGKHLKVPLEIGPNKPITFIQG